MALLDDEISDQNFALRDGKLRFPFFVIEITSQAKGSTHFIATNQAANAGATAMNGYLGLIQRSCRMENFDYNEPQFFSITMDHEPAHVNVHWLKAPVDGRDSFHVQGLTQHLLNDSGGIRILARAIEWSGERAPLRCLPLAPLGANHSVDFGIIPGRTMTKSWSF